MNFLPPLKENVLGNYGFKFFLLRRFVALFFVDKKFTNELSFSIIIFNLKISKGASPQAMEQSTYLGPFIEIEI